MVKLGMKFLFLIAGVEPHDIQSSDKSRKLGWDLLPRDSLIAF